MVRIIFFFLLEKRLVFCDSVMKFVDKMTPVSLAVGNKCLP